MTMSDFNVTSEPVPGMSGGLVIRIRGELDMRTTPRFRDDFAAALGQHTHVLVDLADVTFIDSHNLGTFVGAWQKVRSRGGWIGMVCPQPFLARVFEVTNLDKLFRFFESEDKFLDALTQDGILPPRG